MAFGRPVRKPRAVATPPVAEAESFADAAARIALLRQQLERARDALGWIASGVGPGTPALIPDAATDPATALRCAHAEIATLTMQQDLARTVLRWIVVEADTISRDALRVMALRGLGEADHADEVEAAQSRAARRADAKPLAG